MEDQDRSPAGGPPSPDGSPDRPRSDAQGFVEKMAGHVARAAGVDELEGFSLRELFSEVFKKHTSAEIEVYFTVGTEATTPDLRDVDTSWPRPWVFFRTFIGAVIVYFGFVQAWHTFQNINLVPGLIMVGSFAVPLATLLFFFEVNARKNVSMYQVTRLLFVGGILSLILSLVLFRVTFSLELGWLGASLAGLVEEPGKLLALLLVASLPRYKYILNGLLFGAAVGAGFAAFESAGYALYVGLADPTPGAMLNNIMLRGLLSPFAHIVWTAMAGAALWRVKGAALFRVEMLADARFVRIFGMAVVLHMIWNSPIDLPFYAKNLVLGFVAWVIILALIQDGLKQLRQEKRAAGEGLTPEAPPTAPPGGLP